MNTDLWQQTQQPGRAAPRVFATHVGIAWALLLTELLAVSFSVDAFPLLINPQLAPWEKSFAHVGALARVLVLSGFVFAAVRGRALATDWYQARAVFSSKHFWRWMLRQWLAYAVFFCLTDLIFAHPQQADKLPPFVFVLWVGLALLVATLWIVSLVGLSWAGSYLKREKLTLLVTLFASAVAWGFASASQRAWAALADSTFSVSSFLLRGYGDRLYVDAAKKVLGIDHFAVSIAPACSGYEGIGLIIAFIALYLIVHRRDVRFPAALLLFPIGVATIWLLNCLRIAALVAIGYQWSPQIAVGGFHSQAGWIGFLLTSIGILGLANSTPLISRSPLPEKARPFLTPATATLLPLTVLLSATLLTQAFTAEFDFAYPIRVIAVAAAIYTCWKALDFHSFRVRWEAVAGGLVVAVLWLSVAPANSIADGTFQRTLDGMPMPWQWLWLAFRMIGAVITVPVAEELAFRGYLLGRMSKSENFGRGSIPFQPVAIGVSSLAFGALHHMWLAGTLAGVAFAMVRVRTHNVENAIVAHSIANAAVFCVAIGYRHGSLL